MEQTAVNCVQAQILAQAAFEVSCERHVELELLRDNEVRNDSAVIATLGRLTGPGLSLVTLEPPWQSNTPFESRIPPGESRKTAC